MTRQIHIEQHITPFDYVERCQEERRLMAGSALTWKNAVIAQDQSPHDPHTYDQDAIRVTMHFQDDTKLSLAFGMNDKQELKYEYDTVSHQLSLAGEQLVDGQDAYASIAKAHRAVFDAAYSEREQSRLQQG